MASENIYDKMMNFMKGIGSKEIKMEKVYTIN